MAVVGLGMDLCSVERIKAILDGPRGERFKNRVFTRGEQTICGQRADSASAYAARFAAKEAFVKALGAPPGIRWLDMEVTRTSGPPKLVLSGAAKKYVEGRGQSIWLTMTHDAGMAAATVIVEET